MVSKSLELQDSIVDKLTMTLRLIELQSIPKTSETAATTKVTTNEPQQAET